jgi:hypothetical protein
VDLDELFRRAGGRERPRAVVGPDRVRERTLQNRGLAFDARGDAVFLDVDCEVAPFEVAGDRDADVEVADRLRPFVGEGVLLGLFLGTGGGLFGGGDL